MRSKFSTDSKFTTRTVFSMSGSLRKGLLRKVRGNCAESSRKFAKNAFPEGPAIEKNQSRSKISISLEIFNLA